MNRYTLTSISLLTCCATFGVPALAQSTTTTTSNYTIAPDAQAAPQPAPEPAAPTPPVSTPPSTTPGAVREDPNRAALPSPTIPLAQEERADVVKHTWPNRPMLLTGVVVLGGTYGASAIVGATSDRKADDKLFLPVVGPWLDLKNRDCEVNHCGNDTFNKALLIGDGALQGIGALTLVLSFVVPESTKKPWYLIGDEKLFVTPQVGSRVTGLSAAGSF